MTRDHDTRNVMRCDAMQAIPDVDHLLFSGPKSTSLQNKGIWTAFCQRPFLDFYFLFPEFCWVSKRCISQR